MTEEQLADLTPLAPPAAGDEQDMEQLVQYYEQRLHQLRVLQLVLHVVTCLRRQLQLPPSTLADFTAQVRG